MGKRFLPPGFRFHPTDVELVMYYLKRKVIGKKLHYNFIAEVDIYKHDPWDLPDKSCMPTRDLKWYFFCPTERKYGSGDRQNRATDRGYWKTTGKDRPVHYKGEVVGMKRTLVFHTGKPPRGVRTDWVMHEHRLKDENLADKGFVLDAYVLCVIFHKNGPGPRNGAEYGAPFIEEEWTDGEEEDCVDPASFADLFTQTNLLPVNPSSSVTTRAYAPKSICTASSSEMHPAEATPFVNEALPPVPDNSVILPENPDNQNLQLPDDDIVSLLEMFTDDGAIIPNADTNNGDATMKFDEYNIIGRSGTGACVDGSDIYHDLGDLDNLNGYNFSSGFRGYHTLDESLPLGDSSYLELNDLDMPLEFPTEAGENGCITDDIFAKENCCNDFQQLCDAANPVNDYLHSKDPSGSSSTWPDTF